MILYNQNPNLKLTVVTTVSGKKEYRKNCKLSVGNYYAINVDIFNIDGKWYKIDSPELLLDHETGKRFLANGKNLMVAGIVGYNKVKGFIKGYFTSNPYTNIIVNDGLRNIPCISADVLNGSPYTEDKGLGIWTSTKKDKEIINRINNQGKGYNIEDNDYEGLIKLYDNKPYKMNLAHSKIGNLLKDTTFGIELEASAGNLPKFLLNRTGTAICKDGSLIDVNGNYPPEYVTVPLKGGKGVNNIVELCEYLKPRNEMDIKCSFHLHLGGFNTSRLFLVALHSLSYKLQGEIFKMFPVYKLQPEGIKQKNYCKVLPKIFKQYTNKMDYTEYVNASYKELYKYLSETNGHKYEPCKDCNRKNMVHYGHQKWNKDARYHWLNMINSVFSTRNTLEFRLHTPTFNETKIINWLLICNAICKYAEKYPLKCITNEKISFDDILSYYTDINTSSEYSAFVSKYLKAYVKERVDMFAKDKAKNDILSEHEYDTDKKYKFELDGRSLL